MTNKAPRPCTLWGQTFDSNEVASIDWHYWEDGGIEITVADYIGTTLASFKVEELKDKQIEKKSVLASFKEALHAIASAERPWLKAEGFELDLEKPYYILFKDNSFAIGKRAEDRYVYCDSHGDDWYDYYGDFDIESVLAFKLISDSQQAWDAVAHIKVYKESTNDTQETNR